MLNSLELNFYNENYILVRFSYFHEPNLKPSIVEAKRKKINLLKIT